MEKKDNIVELVDISLIGRGGRKIFENLNFSISEGETAIIAGSTGSGKTQLARLIIGSLKPDRGGVVVFGGIIKSGQRGQLARVRKKIGGAGGIFDLISYQTVYENLMHPLILNRSTISFQKTKIAQVLTRFSLMSKRNDLAGRLSQGEKVRVLLARAIIADQPLLLIDEPLSGVDAHMTEEIRELLGRLSISGHSLIIFTSTPDRINIPGSKRYTIQDGKLV